jgi:hypothetical protein
MPIVSPRRATVAERAGMRRTISSPLYRGATIAMFLSGLGISPAVPQIDYGRCSSPRASARSRSPEWLG